MPKKGRLDVWELIMDLSNLIGHSINDGIDKKDCSFNLMLQQLR